MRIKKRPRHSCRKNPDRLPNCHYNTRKRGSKNRKRKRVYETYDDAMEFIIEHKLENEFTAYWCPVCSKYHIGHKQNIYLEPVIKEETYKNNLVEAA